jgi:hypothetical protein
MTRFGPSPLNPDRGTTMPYAPPTTNGIDSNNKCIIMFPSVQSSRRWDSLCGENSQHSGQLSWQTPHFMRTTPCDPRFPSRKRVRCLAGDA